jgi:signal transduction histidine kinase
VFSFTIIGWCRIREQMLPELASRHFTHVEGDVYRVAVTAADDPTDVLYRSDPDAPVDPQQADASASLFPIANQSLFFGRAPRPPTRDTDAEPRAEGTRLRTDDARVDRGGPRGPEDFGRWRLLVQHQSGSLESAVAGARRRNLGISFGVLLLLTVSIALLAATSRQAHRLAQQQMEFVAGVSHELRTPVAVIRAAAENLSHGVVDGGDRVKRYGQLLETEARRLGEMVERVLQYAGIQSGLVKGARVALAPTEIIEGAIESSLTLLGPEEVRIERQFAPNLPPVRTPRRYGRRSDLANAKIRRGPVAPTEYGRSRRRPSLITVAITVGFPPPISRTSSTRSTVAPMLWPDRCMETGSVCHSCDKSSQRTGVVLP